MKYILFIAFLLFSELILVAQPDNIKRIMAKAKTGQELTEAEEAAMEKYLDSLDSQLNSGSGQAVKPKTQTAATDCPVVKTTPPQIAELTRESYIALAKELQTTFGAKSGDLAGLKSLLETAAKPTDGADMGALFAFQGAGSASVYTIASSAIKEPADLLTANNLGVALKDMGEYTNSLRVLKYADKLKPNIGLVICNLGWVYREMGYNTLAKQQFEKALKAAPEMTSPYLGLGLIAKCEGNMLKAEEYLRKALADKYSAVGMKAYKQAKAAQPPKQEGGGNKPVPFEKGNEGEVEIPDLPVIENLAQMEQQKEPFENYISYLDSRTQQLLADLMSAQAVIRKQQTHAIKNPDNSVVYNRDFAKEIMQFGEITDLLFGPNSNYGQALKSGTKMLENNSNTILKDLPALQQQTDKSLKLGQELIKLIEDLTACGENEICRAKVQAEIDRNRHEAEEVAFLMCKMSKGEMEVSCSNAFKNYKLVADALREAIPDYYAFTNPVIERMYPPSFNEFYNTYRELLVLQHLKIMAGYGANIADLAKGYSKLKCVEPEPPKPPEEVKKPTLAKKDKKDCPLGENGISGGVGALSFELSCDHVKLSGGEGILWSVKRDFNKHETTIWGGVGVKGEYGKGNVTGEATVGVELTIGQGDVIKDVAVTSSVKAGLGGLVEGEISGRLAMEGGASIDSNAGFITPELPDLGDIK